MAWKSQRSGVYLGAGPPATLALGRAGVSGSADDLDGGTLWGCHPVPWELGSSTLASTHWVPGAPSLSREMSPVAATCPLGIANPSPSTPLHTPEQKPLLVS